MLIFFAPLPIFGRPRPRRSLRSWRAPRSSSLAPFRIQMAGQTLQSRRPTLRRSYLQDVLTVFSSASPSQSAFFWFGQFTRVNDIDGSGNRSGGDVNHLNVTAIRQASDYNSFLVTDHLRIRRLSSLNNVLCRLRHNAMLGQVFGIDFVPDEFHRRLSYYQIPKRPDQFGFPSRNRSSRRCGCRRCRSKRQAWAQLDSPKHCR